MPTNAFPDRDRTSKRSVGELVPVPAPPPLAERGERDHLGGLGAPVEAVMATTPSVPGVEPTALRRVQRRTEHVGVVRHLDQERTVDRRAVRAR